MARRVRLPIRLLSAGIATVSLTGVIVAVTTSPASAQSVKAQIASAERQLTTLDNQAESASERYDAARIKLAKAQTTATEARKELTTAQQKVAAAQKAASGFAIAAYRGDTEGMLYGLTSGTTSKFLGRESSIQAVSESQAQALVAINGARRLEEQAQTYANASLAAQASATKSMQSDRDQVIGAASKESKILDGLKVKEAAIIKAAKDKAAKIAAEKAAAAIAARAAAAAAAVQAIQAQPVSSPEPTPAPAPGPVGPISSAGGAATAVSWAKAELGKPYVWGAAGPDSFDCSGLAMYVWAKAGVYLDHFTGDQWNEGTHVSRDQLEPGDLVFFAYNTSDSSTIHHVGIYVGGGEMIDAPYTGVDVRYDPAFRSDYIGAVRP